MNELTDEKRHKLRIGLILIVILFLVIYGTVMFLKYTKHSQNTDVRSEEGQVIFRQPILKFYKDTILLNAYPDRIAIHYPYLLIIRPNEVQSEIYNMETKRKEKEVKEVLLDYFKGDTVYNKNGYQTFFNNKNLGLLCDQAFIKSKTEILCITRPDQNLQSNKLVSLNPQTFEQKDIYASQNVLTAVYFFKKSLYIGEYDFKLNKAFVTVNEKTIPINELVNIFYPIEGDTYAASFKSLRNHEESYSEIQILDNLPKLKLAEKGRIVLY